MDSVVEFEIQSEDDEAILDELAGFFEPVAIVRTKKREPIAAKSWQAVVGVALVIVAEWAAVRYVLDPLADRAGEWFKGVKSVWRKSRSKRPFNVVVRFGPADDAFEVQMSPTIDREALSRIWDHVGEAYQVCEESRTHGVALEKIRIVPDGTQEMLVVGYESNCPKYIVDLENKALRLIDTASPLDEEREVSVQLWLIEQLINRLTYLKVLREHGHSVQEDKVLELEQQIAAEKAKLEVHWRGDR